MNIRLLIGTCWDDTPWENMKVDDKYCVDVSSLADCPEDATIGRSLVSCNEIISLMELAYIAGKNGEEFKVEKVEG